MDAPTFTKIGIDIAFIIGLALTFFSNTFVYMKYISVSLTEVSYHFAIPSFGVDTSSQEECKSFLSAEICDKAERWVYGGIFYLIFSILALIACGLSLGAIASAHNRFKNKFLRLKVYHYLYVALYSIAYLGYALISQVYSLENYELGEEYDMQIGGGLYSMFACQILALSSIGAYYYSRKSCGCGLEEKLIKT